MVKIFPPDIYNFLGICKEIHIPKNNNIMISCADSFNIVELLHAKVNRQYFSFNSQIYIYVISAKKKKS